LSTYGFEVLDLRRKAVDLRAEGRDASDVKVGRLERFREGIQPVDDGRHALRADKSGEREERERKELHGCC
jgi:hypothetical protein